MTNGVITHLNSVQVAAEREQAARRRGVTF